MKMTLDYAVTRFKNESCISICFNKILYNLQQWLRSLRERQLPGKALLKFCQNKQL